MTCALPIKKIVTATRAKKISIIWGSPIIAWGIEMEDLRSQAEKKRDGDPRAEVKKARKAKQ